MINILIVGKNMQQCAEISAAMHEIGYGFTVAEGYTDAMDKLLSAHYDLIIADFYSGACELCRDLRETASSVPFITLVENPSKREKRIIFRSKADGYLEIPFDAEELQMRVRNLLWRCRVVDDSSVVTYGDCRLCNDTYTLETADTCIELRRMEFLLLEKLLSYPGRIFTRAQLLDELWGYDCNSDPRTVDSHIKQLRKKLKFADSIRIQTIRGIGYRAAVPKDRTQN